MPKDHLLHPVVKRTDQSARKGEVQISAVGLLKPMPAMFDGVKSKERNRTDSGIASPGATFKEATPLFTRIVTREAWEKGKRILMQVSAAGTHPLPPCPCCPTSSPTTRICLQPTSTSRGLRSCGYAHCAPVAVAWNHMTAAWRSQCHKGPCAARMLVLTMQGSNSIGDGQPNPKLPGHQWHQNGYCCILWVLRQSLGSRRGLSPYKSLCKSSGPAMGLLSSLLGNWLAQTGAAPGQASLPKAGHRIQLKRPPLVQALCPALPHLSPPPLLPYPKNLHHCLAVLLTSGGSIAFAGPAVLTRAYLIACASWH